MKPSLDLAKLEKALGHLPMETEWVPDLGDSRGYLIVIGQGFTFVVWSDGSVNLYGQQDRFYPNIQDPLFQAIALAVQAAGSELQPKAEPPAQVTLTKDAAAWAAIVQILEDAGTLYGAMAADSIRQALMAAQEAVK